MMAPILRLFNQRRNVQKCTNTSPDESMKVLIVSNMYPTKDHPTGGIFVHDQVKALRRGGVDARVVSGKPLWLSGRRLRTTLSLVGSELRARRRPFVWEDYDGVPTAQFNYFAGAFARRWLYPWIYRDALIALLPAIARDFPFDIVHTHTAFLDGRAGTAAAEFRAVPMVLTEHTGPFSLVTRDWRCRLHTLAGMKKANRVIAVSQALRKEIAKQLPAINEEEILVVPNGVDTAFFDPEFLGRDEGTGYDGIVRGPGSWEALLHTAKRELNRSSFIVGLRESLKEIGDRPVTGRDLARCIEIATLTGIGEGPFRPMLTEAGLPVNEAAVGMPGDVDDGEKLTALWVGHLVDVKRVDRLLDAFAIARRHRPRLRLRLVGGGELEGALRQQGNALGVAQYVRFLPSANRRDVRREMSGADFLVIASETETFGVVGIEAMAMGLPVLATDCGGPASYLTGPQYGELVDNSTEDIAIGLQRMADRIGTFDRNVIRRHAVKNFGFDFVSNQIIGIYSELLAHQKLVRGPQGAQAEAS
jgi:glycosyltransferase involved in cell wall biosynthesis